MEFKRLDKRKGSGAASIRSRYAFLIHISDISYFPPTDEKGVKLEGDIVLHEERAMIPVYLTNPSQEYSYETHGADDEKTFRVKFSGTHPGTELQALEFAKNFLEEPFLVLIPGCEKDTPDKVLGQINNPMIFTSAHKASREGDKFNFTFEQRIGSEYIYYLYGGVYTTPSGPGDEPTGPGSAFDPRLWARIDAGNIDPHLPEWRAKLIQELEDPTEEQTASAPKSRLEDGWRTINNTAPLSIVLGNDPAGSFHLTGTEDITGFTTKMGKFMWPGRGMILYTEHAVTLKHQPQEPTTNAKYFTFAEDFTTKPDGWYILKEKASFIEVVELGADVDLSPYALDADLDAEVVNRAAADLQLQQNINAEQQARINALLAKLDKPLADGIYLIKKAGNVITYEDASDLSVHQITLTTSTNITTNTTDANGRKQHGRNVIIDNGVNAIEIVCDRNSDANFCASYMKRGSADITFVAGPGTFISKTDNTNVLNGKVGSAAVLIRQLNNFYLRISNGL